MLIRSVIGAMGKRVRFGVAALCSVIGFPMALGMVVGGSGCGGSLGGECMLNSDCSDELICAYQFCHVSCQNTSDCRDRDPLAECFIGHEDGKEPYNYCDRPKECSSNVECGADRACSDGRCRDVCSTDEDCLRDQTCFGHICRGPGNPAPNGEPPLGDFDDRCLVHSECKSQNCNGEICVGCNADIDCDGARTCDPTAFDGNGMCVDKATLRATVTPIVLPNYVVIDAVPSSNADAIFVIAQAPLLDNKIGVFKLDPGNAHPLLCALFIVQDFEPNRIAISSDDSTLFVNDQWPDPNGKGTRTGISSLGTDCKQAGKQPDAFTWTEAYYASDIDVFVNDDLGPGQISFPATPFQGPSPGPLLSGNLEKGDIIMATFPYESEQSIGNSTTVVRNSFGQLGKLQGTDPITLITPDIGVPTSQNLAGISLNLDDSAVYVAGFSPGTDDVVRINLINPESKQRYTQPGSFNDMGPTSPGRINRARLRDVYAWVTGSGKLYLFEPK